MKNKSREKRYIRGVERNIWNAEKYRKEKFENCMGFNTAKNYLGIRSNDTSYDEAVKKLIEKKKEG